MGQITQYFEEIKIEKQKRLAAEKERIRKLRVAAEEKWKSKWDADLNSDVIWDNLTDLMRYNKAATISRLSKGHLVRLEYKNKNVEFVQGESVLKDYHKGTDIYEGIPKGKFSWSSWFDMTNSVGSNRSFTVYCKADPDELVGLIDGQQYIFHGKLVSVNDSNYVSRIVLDCKRRDDIGSKEPRQVDTSNDVSMDNSNYDLLVKKYVDMDLLTVSSDAEAMRIGEQLFLKHCASCHGSDAGGGRGFPNLRDSAWLYGATPDAIKTSVLNGRTGVMPAWNAVLQDNGVDEVTAYVLSLSGRDADAAKVAAGKARFETYCVACHGAEGKGNTMLGAPDLTDNVWLYGGSKALISESVAKGRQGRCPGVFNLGGSKHAQEQWRKKEFKLLDAYSNLLSAYVLNLSAENKQSKAN